MISKQIKISSDFLNSILSTQYKYCSKNSDGQSETKMSCTLFAVAHLWDEMTPWMATKRRPLSKSDNKACQLIQFSPRKITYGGRCCSFSVVQSPANEEWIILPCWIDFKFIYKVLYMFAQSTTKTALILSYVGKWNALVTIRIMQDWMTWQKLLFEQIRSHEMSLHFSRYVFTFDFRCEKWYECES